MVSLSNHEWLPFDKLKANGFYSSYLFTGPASDELVKSRNMVFFVIPVKTGIQYLQYVT